MDSRTAPHASSLHGHGVGTSHAETVRGMFGGPADWVPLALLAVPPIAAYLIAAMLTGRRYRRWPTPRSLFWCAGVLMSAAAVAGPLARAGHGSFTAHMLAHLLLGMLGPLLIVLSAPMTLLLRSLPRKGARLLSLVLRSRAAACLTHPVTASLLNVGGLWLLYATDLYAAMHASALLYALIHVHVFAAGYLFTASIFSVDPAPHRIGFRFRACVMIAAFAAHGILGKFLYANPPFGVTAEEARQGAQLMYYGGDGVDLLLIFLFCLRRYKLAGRSISASDSAGSEERTAGLRSKGKKTGYT